MLFNSLEFAVFLPIVFILYWLIPIRKYSYQNGLLVVASYFFYGWWDWRFLSLLFISSLTDYLLGRRMGHEERASHRKYYLYASLLINLSLLGFFKYYGFFVDSFHDAFTFLGFQVEARTLNVILPIGISFYTFQTLSYTIDLYRKKIQPTRDIVAFFAFVSFFPQLVIGPIERAFRMLPQFESPRRFDLSKAKDGLRQILWGLFKKVVIADTINAVVTPIFDHHETYAGIYLLLCVLLFAFQVYADFSGYSDMAIGIARLFGFDLIQNFNYPFFSRDFVEFWQRWHISFSTWLRDYVFISLGGSKVSNWRMYLNLMITFGISGIWHGASGNMVIWGLATGVLYSIARFSGLYVKGRIQADPHTDLNLKTLGQMSLTFLMFAFPLVFVGSSSLTDAVEYYSSLFLNDFWAFPLHLLKTSLWLCILLPIEWVNRKKSHGLEISALPLIVRWLIYLIILNFILFFGIFQQKEFFYFQF